MSGPNALSDGASAAVRLPPEGCAHDLMRRIVREATRRDHQQIDHAISKLDLANRVDYGIFLSIHYRALSALAGKWRAHDHGDFSSLLCCAADDLKVLEGQTRSWVASARSPVASARQWGVAYVIRGARLGGAILRQRVPGGFPTSYLDYPLTLTWPAFLQELDHESQQLNPTASAQIVRGAKHAFAAFSTAATECCHAR